MFCSVISCPPLRLIGQELTDSLQVRAAVNSSINNISVGSKVNLNGEQFIKVNNDGLLMMTSTYACPHGKRIAGDWVYCFHCDNEHGYFDYNNITCACNSGWNYRKSDNKCLICPAHSTWNSTSQVCKCSANYYMVGDNASCSSCPEHSTSSAGSTSVNNCACAATYYLDNNTCAACPPGSNSHQGSTSIADCFCGIGYQVDTSTGGCEEDGTYSSTLAAYVDETNCSNPISWMTSWTGCSSLNTFDTVCLADARDHRTYKVRKLDDGQCWTIDDMKYGGDYGEMDACSSNGSLSSGRCMSANSGLYVYDSTAFSSLCPSGWDLPNRTDFEGLLNLHNNWNELNDYWLNASYWNAVLGGVCWSGSSCESNVSYYWSSSGDGYFLTVGNSWFNINSPANPSATWALFRCVKN